MLTTQPMRPVRGLDEGPAYGIPRGAAFCDLLLDGNEGPLARSLRLDTRQLEDAERVRRYPRAGEFEARLGRRFGIDASRVLVTAGADDSLLRICMALLDPGRELVLPVPTFEMIPRYGQLAGGEIVDVPWMGDRYPIEEVLAAITPRTALVAVVSPNNPTGAVASAADLLRISAAAPAAWILLDEAYAEYADTSLTQVALGLPNVLVVRSLSKAWGLAGLRVGYVAGPEEAIGWLRSAGNPYPVSGPSLALASARLDQEGEVVRCLRVVRRERERLAALLEELGLQPQASQANFVFCRGDADPLWLRDGLAALGVAVRAFPGKPRLEDALRISCPGSSADFARLERGLRLVRRPESLCVEPGLARKLGLREEALEDPLCIAVPRASSAWFLFDAADLRRSGLLEAARIQGVLPFALAAEPLPEAEAFELQRAGVARVVSDLSEWKALLS